MRPSRPLGRATRTARDLEAIQRGRVAQRVTNRLLGKALWRVTIRLWR